MMASMISLTHYFLAINLITALFPAFVNEMLSLYPNVTSSLLNGDIFLTLLEICFGCIQSLRAYSALRPFEYQALHHDRNVVCLLINNDGYTYNTDIKEKITVLGLESNIF